MSGDGQTGSPALNLKCPKRDSCSGPLCQNKNVGPHSSRGMCATAVYLWFCQIRKNRVSLCYRATLYKTICGSRTQLHSTYVVFIINPLAAKLFNLNFHPLKLCLADAIHNFKWVKIIQIWQNGGQLFSNIADWCQILSLTCLRGGT